MPDAVLVSWNVAGRLRRLPEQAERVAGLSHLLRSSRGWRGSASVTPSGSLHGFRQREPSWVWPRSGGSYRLDHLIVSSAVEVRVCGYLHEWRDEGLSDHSPLVAHIRWPAGEHDIAVS